MLFPVIKLYVFVLTCRNLVDAGLVRVKRSVYYGDFDVNALQLNSPEWVRKHLKNKVIQEDAITFELGIPHYEILNPEDMPEIITHEHPDYHENLKLYGHHEDYEHYGPKNNSVHYDYEPQNNNQHYDQQTIDNNQEQHEHQQVAQNSKETLHQQAAPNTKETQQQTSGENDKSTQSDESNSNEGDESEEAPFKFIFIKAKNKPTSSEEITAKKPDQSSEVNEHEIKKQSTKTQAMKKIQPDDYQNHYKNSNIQHIPEVSMPRTYEAEEPQAAASALSYPQYVRAPYSPYQPDYISSHSSPYINPFNYYNYNYGSTRAPYLRDFDQFYRSELEILQNTQYNNRLYAPTNYYR